VFDIVTVGHFVIDSIYLPVRRAPFVALGGSVTYVSLAARRLGVRVSVVSKVGNDFPSDYFLWLKNQGIDLSHILCDKSSKTTRFELKYSEGFSSRTLRLLSRASSFSVDDFDHFPKSLAVHVGPVAGEITYEVMGKLRNCGKIISFDPPGVVRCFDAAGNVTLGPLNDRRVLEHVDIFKSSLREIKSLTSSADLDQAVKTIHDFGVDIVIVTRGERGAAVSFEGKKYDVPAFVPTKVVDPTGAGDAFIGCFLAEYIRGKDCFWSSCVGAAGSSLMVESIGAAFSGDSEEIYRRARVLYEKGIKE